MKTGRKTIKGTSPKRYQGGFGKGGFGKEVHVPFFQKEHTFCKTGNGLSRDFIIAPTH
jgi:hypothetical protein